MLCAPTAANKTGGGGICDTPLLPSGQPQRSIDNRASAVIVFSTSSANITINGGATIALPACNPATGPGGAKTFTVTVIDQNGNAMPAGTAVSLVPTNGTVTSVVPASGTPSTGTSTTGFTIGDSSACRTNYAGCPPTTAATLGSSATFGDFAVTMQTDAVLTYEIDTTTGVASGADCLDPTGSSGTLTVKVTSPKGIVSTSYVGVTD